MTTNETVEHILTSGGQFCSLKFVKRTTGELREMLCRTGVTKHLRGGERAYDPVPKRLLCVYDMQAAGYRNIPIDNITAVKVAGEWRGVSPAQTSEGVQVG